MEEAPGQFNFINSQLRMNENYMENQNEFEKMSLMVKSLVSCKIDHIFKDINHAKNDLKMRIELAIEANRKTEISPIHDSTEDIDKEIDNLNQEIEQIQNGNDPNNADVQATIAALKIQIDELQNKKAMPHDANSANSQEDINKLINGKTYYKNALTDISNKALTLDLSLNSLKKENERLTQEIEALKKTSNVTNVTNVTNAPPGDLKTQLKNALARIKELEDAPKSGANTITSNNNNNNSNNSNNNNNNNNSNNNSNNNNNDNNNNSNNTDNSNNNNNNNNRPQRNNSKNTFTDFVIGHYTP